MTQFVGIAELNLGNVQDLEIFSPGDPPFQFSDLGTGAGPEKRIQQAASADPSLYHSGHHFWGPS